MQLPPVDRSLSMMPSTDTGSGSGAIAPEPVRPGVTQPRTDTRDYLGKPQGARGPDSPSSAPETPNRDWTEVRKQESAKAPEEPPKEPIYKMLMEQIQSIWRASSQAVDIAEESQRQANRLAAADGGNRQGPIVYSDPAKVKRPPSSSSV